MHKIKFSLPVLFFSVITSGYACQQKLDCEGLNVKVVDETLERENTKQDILDLYLAKKWQYLDKLEKEYISDFPSTSSGTQKLVLFYSAFGIFHDDPKALHEIANEWLLSQPGSSAANLIHAMAINAEAMLLRGEGSIDSVDPAALPEIRKRFNEEKSFLQEIKSIADNDPFWFQEMETVARYLNDESLLEKTLEEGSKKFPDYQNIYLEAMIMALPKWGGSPEKIENISRLAVARTSSKSGYSLYSYLWHNAFLMQPDLVSLLNNDKIVSWKDLNQGWIDRYKSYPTSYTVSMYMSQACVAKDKKAFAEAFKLINEDNSLLEQNAWIPGTGYNECVEYLK